jgi:phosphate:Na+ symporter
MSNDQNMAHKLLQEKEAFRDLEQNATESHHERLREGLRESLETSSLHLDIIRDFKRINSHICSVAYPILDNAGGLRTSRLRKGKMLQLNKHRDKKTSSHSAARS